jgi:hypothetical protein
MTLEELRTQRDTLGQRRADLAAAEAALPGLAARAEAADQARHAAVAALAATRARLAERIAARDALPAARAAVEDAERAVAELDGHLAALQPQLAALRRQVTMARRFNLPTLRELERQLAELEQQARTVQTQLDAARTRADAARVRLQNLTVLAGEIPAAEAEVRQAEAVAAPLAERADALEAELAALRTAARTLSDEVKRLAADYQRQLDSLIGTLDTTVPLVLLPVRLETRFMDRPGGGSDLLVRVYPDDVHQDAHERGLSADEIGWGRHFWEQSQEAGSDEALRRQAWTQFAGRFGPARAAWIARETEPTRAPQPRERAPRGAYTRVLPDRWVALGYQDGKCVFTAWGDLIPHPLPTAPVPSAAGRLDESTRWMVDFERAAQDGMGIRVPNAPEALDLLVVLGVKATLDAEASQRELHTLLEAHRYTWGLDFVPQGTPTNNSAAAPSGYAARDLGYETSFALLSAGALYSAGDGSDGDVAARALGLASSAGEPLVLARVPHANGRDQTGAAEINTALWPATWGYFLRQMMADLFVEHDLETWREFFIQYVRARGPLPALRVGNQPYGLLPVTSLDLWQLEELRPELLVFHIANLAGENQGFYRIGWDLVMRNGRFHRLNEWSDPTQVPGWFGAENQGAGIAVADINGNGRPDLVVFHIDNAPGRNYGFYRIGWDVDGQGVVSRWSAPLRLPDPFADETRGGGIALADVDHNGQPDLIVFYLNRVSGDNEGYYRIGWNLDQTGQVTGGWSAPTRVPGPFGDDNQGADIAVADLTGGGRLDLTVFHLARIGGEVYGYCRIGYGLDASGQVNEGWSEALGTGASYGNAAQGAGIAVADIGRSRRISESFDSNDLVNLLTAIRETWRAARDGQQVPHVGRSANDPDEELVRMLGMEPISSSFAGRSLLGPDYTRALWFFLGNSWFVNPTLQDLWEGRQTELASHALKMLSFPWDARPWRKRPGEKPFPGPRLLHSSYATDAFRVEGPLVWHGSLSESTPLPDAANYIAWLRQASPHEIHAQAGVPAEVGRDELLYRLLRHATLWAYADAALRLKPLVPDDSIEARQQGREPELVDLDDLHTPDPRVIHSWTPWRHLGEQTLDGESLAEVLHQNPARDRLLAEFLRSLDWLADQPTAALERLCAEALDLSAHRLDAWITSCATRRLWQMRQSPSPGQPAVTGLQLGGYGWVEKLQRRADDGRASAGYIHAPSLAHAATAAILRSGYLSHQGSSTGDVLAIDLSSERVRHAQWLLDGVRQGQSLGALLGYRFERTLHDLQLDQYIATLRELYPLTARKLTPSTEPVEAIAATNVVDGLHLLRQWQDGAIPFGEERTDDLVPLPERETDDYEALGQALEALEQVVDAASDAVTAESVYQVVQGNPLRAGASLDAIARGEAPPPDLEVVRSARRGTALTHRVVTLFSGEATGAPGWTTNEWQARVDAEPHLNAWVARLLPQPARVRYRAHYLDRKTGALLAARDDLTLEDLELSPLDILYTTLPGEVTSEELDPDAVEPAAVPPGDEMQRSELEQRMVYHLLRTRPTGVSADARVRLRFARQTDWSQDDLTLPEFLEIVRVARELITGARALEAGDLAPASMGQAAPGTVLAELEGRAEVVEGRLQGAHATLAGLLEEARSQLTVLPGVSAESLQDLRRIPADLWEQVVFSSAQWEAVRAALLRLSYVGLDGAVPVSAAEAPDTGAQVRLFQQAATVTIEAERRLENIGTAAQRVQETLADPTMSDVAKEGVEVQYHLVRLHEIFGRGFRVLPRFSPSSHEALQEAFTGSAAFHEEAAAAVVPWFQRSARVRDGVERLDATLLYAEATNAGDGLDLRVAQLPYREGDRWVALPVAPGQSMPGGRLSLVAHAPTGLDFQSSTGESLELAGLLVDEWVEVVPSPTETTALTVHYDAPGACAPQAMLLAVPPDPRQAWSLETLATVLLETLDLATLRAVDSDALEQVGHFLPALYFAFNAGGDTIATDFAAS